MKQYAARQMNYLDYYTDDCINVQEQELDSQMLFHLFSTLYIAPFKIPHLVIYLHIPSL